MTLFLASIIIIPPLLLLAAISHIDSDSTPSDVVKFYDHKIPFDKVLQLIVNQTANKELITILSNYKELIAAIIAAIIPTIGGIVTGLWAIRRYNQDKIAKRKDIVFPLIEEFDKSKEMEFAKKILDEKPIIIDLLKCPKYYNEQTLKTLLRYHSPDDEFDFEAKKIRKSFDALLNFFCKLDYLRSIDLVKEKEIDYFRFYIDKAARNPAVLCYIRQYRFPLYGKLHYKLNIESEKHRWIYTKVIQRKKRKAFDIRAELCKKSIAIGSKQTIKIKIRDYDSNSKSKENNAQTHADVKVTVNYCASDSKVEVKKSFLNKTNNLEQSFSWKIDEEYTPGTYTIEIEVKLTHGIYEYDLCQLRTFEVPPVAYIYI